MSTKWRGPRVGEPDLSEGGKGVGEAECPQSGWVLRLARFEIRATIVVVCVDIVLRLCAAQEEIPSGEEF
eukprot:scaffold10878_cov76-Isochrysis_galbana.AAC.1